MKNTYLHQFRSSYYIIVTALLLSIKLFISPSFMEIQYQPSALYLLNILGTVLILYAFCFLIKNNRARFIYVFTIYGISSLLIVTQIVYIRYFTRPVSIYTLLQLSNLNGLGNSIWSLMSLSDVIMLADVPVLLFFFFPILKKGTSTRKLSRASLSFSLGMILILIMPVNMAFIQKKPLLYPWREWENLIHYNIVEYQFIDLFITVTSRTTLSLDSEEEQLIQHWLDDNRKFNTASESGDLFGIARNKNIIIIQCEALGNFVVNRKYGNRELTPHLNRFIRESLYFSHHHCQNFHGGTSDAELILFTSLYPLMKGSTFFRYPGNNYLSLPKLAREEGYATAAIHGNQKSFWNRSAIYPSLGIDEFYDAEKMFGKKEWINDDGIVFGKSISILKKLKKPFFAVLITIETHLGTDLLNISGYFDAIHKLDESLGKFIADLKKAGLYDNSVIVLYGDHIPYLKYNEIIKRNPSLVWTHGPGREVPFVMHIPGVPPSRIERVTAHVDAYPAIAHLMGIDPERYAGNIMGKNLLTTSRSYALTYPDEYIGDEKAVNTAELAHRKIAFHVGDLIIRSDYFAGHSDKFARREEQSGDKKKI